MMLDQIWAETMTAAPEDRQCSSQEHLQSSTEILLARSIDDPIPENLQNATEARDDILFPSAAHLPSELDNEIEIHPRSGDIAGETTDSDDRTGPSAGCDDNQESATDCDAPILRLPNDVLNNSTTFLTASHLDSSQHVTTEKQRDDPVWTVQPENGKVSLFTDSDGNRRISSISQEHEAQAQQSELPSTDQALLSSPTDPEPVINTLNGPNAVATQTMPEIQPDLDITDEAYAESTSMSYFSSIASEISRGILENERLYPQYGQYSYGMPVDEEEMDRMDLQHRKYAMVIGDKHFLAPIGPTPQRILDLCTGTGIWALDVADMFPSAQVIGIDIAPIQPRWVAPNCEFDIDDVEADWTFQKNSFDFIHLRDPLYVVRDWPKLMDQCYEHLKPGGWCEVACIYPAPMCDDGSMPPDSGFKIVCDKLVEASQLFGAPADCPVRFAQYFQQSRFIDIAEHIFKVPSSPWPKDKRLKKIGALELTNVVEGATAFGLRAFEQAFGWSKEQTELAMIGFRRDVRNRNYHQYCQYFVVYGRKPMNTLNGAQSA